MKRKSGISFLTIIFLLTLAVGALTETTGGKRDLLANPFAGATLPTLPVANLYEIMF